MIKLYTPLILAFFLSFSVNAQDKKSTGKTSQTSQVSDPAADEERARAKAASRPATSPDPKAERAAKRDKEKLAKLEKTAPSAALNPDLLKKLEANLKEDASENLVNPVIIVPVMLKDNEQNNIFQRLKVLTENDRPTSTFIQTHQGEKLAFVINSKEAFGNWAASNPTLLQANVYEGTDALMNARESNTSRIVALHGLHKLIDNQLKKRTAPGSMTPTSVKPREDVIQTAQ